MSTFFKALERAEQENALRHRAPTSEPPREPAPSDAPVPSTPEAAPAIIRESLFRPQPDAMTRLQQRPTAPADRAALEEHLVSLLTPTSFEAEQYRALRHSIEQLKRSADLSVIAVSSPNAADGKTTTAVNLAGTLAQAHDTRVLLIDADLRSPNVAGYLGLDDDVAPGLVERIVDATLTLDAVAQPCPHLNLSVITAGRRPIAPYEVLKSSRVEELLSEARTKYDYVIIDTPPLVSVPDSRVMAKFVDGFLIVVGAHRTPRKLLEEALNVLEPSKIVGMVFNGDDRHLSRDSYASGRLRLPRSGTHKQHSASSE